MSDKDYYYILGVDKNATQEEIKSAYRERILKLHPDRNSGDKFFSDMFTEVTEAFLILSNENKRYEYDQQNTSHKTVIIPKDQYVPNQNYEDTFGLIAFRWILIIGSVAAILYLAIGVNYSSLGNSSSISTSTTQPIVSEKPIYNAGSFSVSFPSQPTVENKKSVGFITGNDVNFTQYECDENNGACVVFVYYLTMPENQREQWYKLMIQYSAKTISANIAYMGSNTQNGIQCYEAKLIRKDISCLIRVLYRNGKLYAVMYMCPEKNFYNNKYADFINSFKVN